jgi:uncharacterized protein YjbJ (UPF0337 family)
MTINKQQIKGRAEQATGKVKEVVGKAVGNEKLQSKGNTEKNLGAAKAAIADALAVISNVAKAR